MTPPMRGGPYLSESTRRTHGSNLDAFPNHTVCAMAGRFRDNVGHKLAARLARGWNGLICLNEAAGEWTTYDPSDDPVSGVRPRNLGDGSPKWVARSLCADVQIRRRRAVGTLISSDVGSVHIALSAGCCNRWRVGAGNMPVLHRQGLPIMQSNTDGGQHFNSTSARPQFTVTRMRLTNITDLGSIPRNAAPKSGRKWGARHGQAVPHDAVQPLFMRERRPCSVHGKYAYRGGQCGPAPGKNCAGYKIPQAIDGPANRRAMTCTQDLDSVPNGKSVANGCRHYGIGAGRAGSRSLRMMHNGFSGAWSADPG